MKNLWILIVAVILLVIGVVTGLSGYNVGSTGDFALGYFAAGQFAAGVFAAGTFSAGIFSIGLFSVGIFSLSIFNIAIYGIGIYTLCFRKGKDCPNNLQVNNE
jgi:hypothetical protein